MTAYYNENDPYAAQWLRNLIDAGHIARGDVDERSIIDVRADDLRGYEQAHFFAGIGGWSYALRLAGWPDDRHVWTGSCPCQSLSSAGQRKGHADKRHLWPAFYRLIAECQPAIVFGEQVESTDGREWLAGVRADLEALGFACGAADLCAAGVGSPQIRQRIYWLAHANGPDQNGRPSSGQQSLHDKNHDDLEGVGGPEGEQRHGRGTARPGRSEFADASSAAQGLGGTTSEQVGQCRQPWQLSDAAECDDGWRRLEPGAQPLVDGVSARLDKIRGYGNAIVPQLAAEFIEAATEALTGGSGEHCGMSRMHTMEKLARDICWAGFSHPDARRGKTKDSYWKSLPESTRQNYRAEAGQFRYLLGRLNVNLLNEVSSLTSADGSGVA